MRLITSFSFAVSAALFFYGCVADGDYTIILHENEIKKSSNSEEISSSSDNTVSSSSDNTVSSSSDNAVSSSSVSSSSGTACATWGNWVEETPATCEKEGAETRTCTSGNSNPETRPIDKLEWGKWEIETSATQTTLAKGKRTCPNGEIDEQDLAICGADTPFAPEEQFCYNDKVGNLCGKNPQKSYDPDLYECKVGKNGIYLKGGIPDSRDFKTYDAVLIGEQVWMAENLNYDADGSNCGTYITSTVNGTYELSDTNTVICDAYGRLYTWATAHDLLSNNCDTKSDAYCNVSEKHQGVCPNGWHIPSDADWNTLMRFVNPNCSVDNSDCAGAGTKLKSVSDWNPSNGIPAGTDDYGFAALPGGWGSSNGTTFATFSTNGCWWSTSQFGQNAHSRHIYYNSEDTKYMGNIKTARFSIRCVRDQI